MATQLLINTDDILSRTSLSGNIDMDKLLPHIENAQIIELLPRLGDGLYNKLLGLVGTGDIDLPENEYYKTLWLNYVTPALVFYTMEQFLPFHQYTIANAGVDRPIGDNTQEVTKEEVDFLTQKYRNNADAYANNMDDYLCKYSDQFPEMQDNELKDKQPAGYRTGLYLGGYGRTRPKRNDYNG